MIFSIFLKNFHFYFAYLFRPAPPMVMWAQRPNLIFLTVCLEDTKDPQIEVDTEKLYFKAVGGPEKKMHEVTINFHGEIDKEVGKILLSYFVK